MSKENEKKYANIDDPLESLGLEEEAEEIEEIADDIIGGADEIKEELWESEKAEEKTSALSGTLAAVKEKTAEILKPVVETAEKKLSLKTAGIILGAVLVAAIALSILVFSLYNNAVYTSDHSIDDWAQQWNETLFTDKTQHMGQSYYTVTLGQMLNSDTDHVRLTDEDVAALKKGKTITILDGLVSLSAETYKGDFKSATFTVDHNEMCEYYYGENFASDSSLWTYGYMPPPIDNVSARMLVYMGLMMNPLNDYVNTGSELFTAGIELFNSYPDAAGCKRVIYGDYLYEFSYTIKDFVSVVTPTDISGTDASASDMKIDVDSHTIYTFTASFNKNGMKKHPADWSWWNDLFKKDEKKEPADDIIEQASATDLSATDISGSDVSASDIVG